MIFKWVMLNGVPLMQAREEYRVKSLKGLSSWLDKLDGKQKAVFQIRGESGSGHKHAKDGSLMQHTE